MTDEVSKSFAQISDIIEIARENIFKSLMKVDLNVLGSIRIRKSVFRGTLSD